MNELLVNKSFIGYSVYYFFLSSPPVAEPLEQMLESDGRPRSSILKEEISPVPPLSNEDQPLTRHRSQGEAEDPGVIGPLVWDLHCHRLHKQGHTLW